MSAVVAMGFKESADAKTGETTQQRATDSWRIDNIGTCVSAESLVAWDKSFPAEG